MFKGIGLAEGAQRTFLLVILITSLQSVIFVLCTKVFFGSERRKGM